MASREGAGGRAGNGFAFLSRSTPFRSARTAEIASSSQQMLAVVPAPADGYKQLVDEPHSASSEPWLSSQFYSEALRAFNFYDPSLWLPTIYCNFKGIMFWPWVILTVSVTVMAYYFIEISPEHKVTMPMDAHVVMGGALSFLVVMRTDASMNRWWEARCSWTSIIDSCLYLGANTATAMPTPEARELLLMQIMAFVVCLKAWLRDEAVRREEVGPRMDWQYVRRLNASHLPPVSALRTLSETVRTHLLTRDSAMGTSVYDEASDQLRQLQHAIGACKKIKSTPMTFGYVATLRSFLMLWLATIAVPLIGEFQWMAIPVSSLIGFLFLNVEQMSVEIEQPFGDDANDLPIEDYIMDLEKVLLEMRPNWQPTLGAEEEVVDTADATDPADADGASQPAIGRTASEEALERRLAALESAWHAEAHAQAQQISQLTTELSRARATGRLGPQPGAAGVAPACGAAEDWNKVSPVWSQGHTPMRNAR